MKQQEEIERLAEEVCCEPERCERKCECCMMSGAKGYCIKIANVVLSQQWKSVEDELPETEGEYSEVFIKLFDKDIEIYSVGCFTKKHGMLKNVVDMQSCVSH